MTIINYNDTVNNQHFTMYYTGRDGFVTKAILKNQEGKQEYVCVATVQSEGVVVVDTTDLRSGSFNINTTFSVDLTLNSGEVVYSDIIVFEDRLDSQSDYNENEDSDEGYVFA